MKGMKYMRMCSSMVLAFLFAASTVVNIGCNIETIPTESDPAIESDAKTGPTLETMPETIEVAVGETFTIALNSNPTTGYSWQPEFDPNFLELFDTRFVPSSTELVGAPGVEIFGFRALNWGQTRLIMKYKRPWEEECIDEGSTMVNIVSRRSETLTVNQGETLTISLVSNPTTGYSWQPEFDPDFLELVDTRFVCAPTELVGAPGVEIFEFRALKEGQVELRMVYKRPWDAEHIDEWSTVVEILPASE